MSEIPFPARARVTLLPGRDKAVRQGHPWLFSGAIAREEAPADASVAEVLAASGEPLGVGFYSPRSQIRVRFLAPAGVEVGRDLLRERLADAALLRRQVIPAATTGYRLVNAEGDGLPGWTIDRFGDVLASQITVAGLEAMRDEAYAALAELFPESTILHLGRASGRRDEGLSAEDVEIVGPVPPAVEFLEHDLRFEAEPAAGQKTGFYCDQRKNRRLAERLAGGRRVLDLFAHTGAFALYALRGGAASVACVESSPRFEERARAGAERNGLDGSRLEWTRADVFDDLRLRHASYDLVVCDPPPLAPRRANLDAAARSYKDLNRLALRRLAPGGYFLTFSCSGAVDGKLFRQILFAAAGEAGVNLQLLAPLAAGPDHPVAVTHPQGEYLKGWLARVPGGG
jgi:23S rRNA (cytosine1962-C5)-methyltransferase